MLWRRAKIMKWQVKREIVESYKQPRPERTCQRSVKTKLSNISHEIVSAYQTITKTGLEYFFCSRSSGFKLHKIYDARKAITEGKFTKKIFRSRVLILLKMLLTLAFVRSR